MYYIYIIDLFYKNIHICGNVLIKEKIFKHCELFGEFNGDTRLHPSEVFIDFTTQVYFVPPLTLPPSSHLGQQNRSQGIILLSLVSVPLMGIVLLAPSLCHQH